MTDIVETQSQPGPPTLQAYYRAKNQHLFTIQLEFLSSLASPAYLTHLAQTGHLTSAPFLRFVAHLYQTWSQPTYAKFLRHPMALVFAKALITSEEFRNVVGSDGWEVEIQSAMVKDWAERGRSQASLRQLEGIDTINHSDESPKVVRRDSDAKMEGAGMLTESTKEGNQKEDKRP